MKLYATIAKTEEQDDGTIKVWGYASSEATDSEGEIIVADAMRAALPDYMKFGAVREMHQSKAAGTAIEAEVQDDGRTFFGAHVVDTEAVKKVKTQTYKGFSIGGQVTERDAENPNVITGLRLVEVSLVDRPANPEAVFTMYKADAMPDPAISAVDELAKMLDDKVVTPEQLVVLAKNETLAKGLYDVANFAQMLQNIGWMVGEADWEKEWEGDDSPVPDQLRGWLRQGAAIFSQMADEEISELLASIQPPPDDGTATEVAMADGTKGLEKAGKKFSKETRTTLKGIHEAMKDCCDKLDAMGYNDDAEDGSEDGKDNKKDDMEDADKAAAAGALAKSASDALTKLQGELDAAKAENATLAKQCEDLAAGIQDLLNLPRPGKALLKSIGRGEDLDVAAGSSAITVEPIRKADGSIDEAATAIKTIRQLGGTRIA